MTLTAADGTGSGQNALDVADVRLLLFAAAWKRADRVGVGRQQPRGSPLRRASRRTSHHTPTEPDPRRPLPAHAEFGEKPLTFDRQRVPSGALVVDPRAEPHPDLFVRPDCGHGLDVRAGDLRVSFAFAVDHRCGERGFSGALPTPRSCRPGFVPAPWPIRPCRCGVACAGGGGLGPVGNVHVPHCRARDGSRAYPSRAGPRLTAWRAGSWGDSRVGSSQSRDFHELRYPRTHPTVRRVAPQPPPRPPPPCPSPVDHGRHPARAAAGLRGCFTAPGVRFLGSRRPAPSTARGGALSTLSGWD